MKETVKKYLIPNEKNAFQPHLLRKGGIAVVAGLATFIFAFGAFQNTLLTKTDFLSAVIAKVLVSLANDNRIDEDISLLTTNSLLQTAAEAKAADMAAKGYFAHNSPDGTTPWYWIKEAGYKFAYAGENLAVNFSDSEDVDDAWMASPGHRANIMNGKFTEIGIATARGTYKGHNTVFVVQMFGRPSETIAADFPTENAEISGQLAVNDQNEPEETTDVNVLGEASGGEEFSDRVLSETETFIAVENVEDAPNPASAPVLEADEANEAGENGEANTLEELATAPKRVVNGVSIALMGLLVLALGLMVGIEIRRQHPKRVFAGLVLLAFILALSYIYQTAFYTTVTVL